MTFAAVAAHALDARVAVGAAGDSSLAELLSDVARLRSRLAEEASGSVVVACRDRYAFAVALLAAWECGRSVALPPNAQADAVEALARDVASGVLLHDTDSGRGIDVRSVLGEPLADPPRLASISADRILVHVHTSGTTECARVFEKTAAQLLGEAALLASTFEFTPDDVVVATVPPQHLYGLLFGILVPLAARASFARESPFHAAEIAATSNARGGTLLVSVPAHLRSLEVLSREAWPRSLRRIFSSGAPLPDDTATMIGARFEIPITEILGSSETGGIAYRRPPAIGFRPLPGVHVDAGEDGRLRLDSPFVSRSSGPYVASDRIEILPDGLFRHLGRVDDVIKIAGKRLDLRALEDLLRRIPGVRDVALLAEPAPFPRGARVRVAVVAPELRAEDVRRAMLARFDPVVVPRKVYLVPRLPREATGKLPRAALEAFFAALRAEDDPDAAFDPAPGDPITALRISIPEGSSYFRGHFEGDPILPAVTQLESIVARQARRHYPELGHVRRLRKLKFRRPIRPGTTVTLRLVRTDAHAVSFEISEGAEVASSGTLEFGGDDR